MDTFMDILTLDILIFYSKLRLLQILFFIINIYTYLNLRYIIGFYWIIAYIILFNLSTVNHNRSFE